MPHFQELEETLNAGSEATALAAPTVKGADITLGLPGVTALSVTAVLVAAKSRA